VNKYQNDIYYTTNCIKIFQEWHHTVQSTHIAQCAQRLLYSS